MQISKKFAVFTFTPQFTSIQQNDRKKYLKEIFSNIELKSSTKINESCGAFRSTQKICLFKVAI